LGRSIGGMDLIAVALALVAFIALYGLIELVDRIWAPPTCSAWSCPRWSPCTCSTPCCAGSAS